MGNNHQKIKKLNLERLCKNRVVLLYLFGSVARRASHKESDVDIAVLFNNKIR
ncbi:MAG: nucleotidyltransferase domain-containing protein, partial [bacterium]